MSHYDGGLVALSLAIALLAAYCALHLAGRVSAAVGGARMLWLACGAAAVGSGIWATHYVGMLAFQLPVTVHYHGPTMLASWLAALFAAGTALWETSRRVMR